MEFNNECVDWIKDKVISEIFGCCCVIANNDPNRFKSCSIPIIMLPAFKDLVFLIKNFSELFNKDKVIEEYLIKNKDSHWYSSLDLFNKYIKMSLVEVRDQKLTEII